MILSYGIYHTVSLWFIDRDLLFNFAISAAILVVGYFLLVIITYSIERVRSNIDVSIWRCLSSCLLNCRTLIACVLVCGIMFTTARPLLGFPVMELQEDIVFLNTSDASTEGETISKNMDVVLLLQEDEWSHLDAGDRLNVMKTIADIEANYLGIPELSVCTEVLEEHTMGHYNDNARTITLNLSYLANADTHTMLTTICHECL